jgi:hypothetical protein
MDQEPELVQECRQLREERDALKAQLKGEEDTRRHLISMLEAERKDFRAREDKDSVRALELAATKAERDKLSTELACAVNNLQATSQENQALVQELVRLQHRQHNPGLVWVQADERSPEEDEYVLARGYSRGIRVLAPAPQPWWCRILMFRGGRWHKPLCEDQAGVLWTGFTPIAWAKITNGEMWG